MAIVVETRKRVNKEEESMKQKGKSHRLPEAAKLSPAVYVRLNVAETRLLDEACAARGVYRADLVRTVLREWFAKLDAYKHASGANHEPAPANGDGH